MRELHPYQIKLLQLLKDGLPEGYTLRDIAREIGAEHPYTVSYHLEQLEDKGYLRRNPANPTDYQVLESPLEEVAHLPLYDTAQAGPNGRLALDIVEEYIPLPTKEFGIVPDQDFLVRVRGDSMEPKAEAGDYALVRRTPHFESGDVVVVTYKDMPMIKKYWVSDGKEVLVSLNEKYEPIVIENPEDLRKYGVVKNIIKIEGPQES